MRQLRDPEALALTPIVQGEIRRALDALPADFRLAVVLCDVEEFSYEEIAQMMGCPIGTVMSRLHRGRKLLQRALYNHAIAMGVIKGEERVGEPAGAGVGASLNTASTASLDEYRVKKRRGAA